MARDAKQFSVQELGNVALPLATETVIATLAGVRSSRPDTTVTLMGVARIAGAVGVTGVSLIVRRDSLTGAIVGDGTLDAIPGAVERASPIVVRDTRGELAGVTYVLVASAQGAAATKDWATLSAIVT